MSHDNIDLYVVSKWDLRGSTVMQRLRYSAWFLERTVDLMETWVLIHLNSRIILVAYPCGTQVLKE